MRAAGNARRSAAATGMAWTMSPSAPSRTIRKRHVVTVCGDLPASEQSRVAWSFGSPTIAVRPPYACTTARSGTVSTV